MKINTATINNLAFKAVIPVRYMALDKDGIYRRMTDPDDIKNCQIRISRILNAKDPSSLKNENAKKFIDFYSEKDNDYLDYPQVTSVFPFNPPPLRDSYMITGHDVDYLRSEGKNIGTVYKICEKEAENMTFEDRKKYIAKHQRMQKNRYYDIALNIAKNRYKKLKNKDGDELCLKIYFNKEYKKRSGEFKDYVFANARFCTKDEIIKADEAKAEKMKIQKKQEKTQLTGKPIIPADENYAIEEND